MALQDGAPRFVRRRLEGRAAAGLRPEVLERAGADAHLRLVPRAPRGPGRRRRHAPRPVEPAGARRLQEALVSAEAWDAIFDELYLKTYARLQADESGDEEIEQLVSTVALEPPADVLDSAAGYGRHALALARRGFRVTAHDRSPVLLAEAQRRAGELELTFVQGDYRELPFPDASFDLVLNLFSAIGYWGDEG